MLDLAQNSSLSLAVKHGHSQAEDEAAAVAELAAQIGRDPRAVVIFFCSPAYALDRLAKELSQTFTGTLIGCSSNGQIGPKGYSKGGITATSLQGKGLRAKNYFIDRLDQAEESVITLSDEIRERGLDLTQDWKRFGLLLVDGLSMAEEKLATALYTNIGRVPFIGGSAGDDMKLEKAWVYHDGRFVSGAATFAVFESTLPFQAFKFQHFAPTEKKLVVTAADPAKRLVTEINGVPAGEAYAEALGLRPTDLNPVRFWSNPLLLKLGRGHYIRSVMRMHNDLSLSFACAIEEGMVLALGKPMSPLQVARESFEGLRRAFEPQVIIGCDCIFRRLELEDRGLDRAMGTLLAENQVIGFSTYGEQFNAMHMNQTFTGIAIGESHAY